MTGLETTSGNNKAISDRFPNYVLGVLFIVLLGDWVGLGLGISAVIAIVCGVIVTGALHEDGLADCADGFWGGWTKARRLEIMKDSVIGTYGMIALVLSLLLRWYVLTLMIDKGALVGAVLGVGMARGIAAINLRVVQAIFVSWIVTLPAGALLAVVFYF